MRFLIVLVIAFFIGATGWGYHWLNNPLAMRTAPADLSIEPGTGAREIAADTAKAGVDVNQSLLYWWFRISGDSRKIKAGSYEIEVGTTPRSLLQKLVQGDEALRSLTLVEGWNIRQVRAALRKADQLKPLTQAMSDEELMNSVGKPGIHPEGQFFPDTYTYAKGSTDIAVLQRASRAMEKHLERAWAQRSPQSSLRSAQELLTLASIVEKETGSAADRPMVASVFNNRLRIGMRLQTDPTVIYGLGERFDGNLRKIDLLTDTPWNTYTRAGLPPTPISMPGKASLMAAVLPAESKAMYFVAKGNGSSHFSATLDEHNRAVNKYQRGQ